MSTLHTKPKLRRLISVASLFLLVGVVFLFPLHRIRIAPDVPAQITMQSLANTNSTRSTFYLTRIEDTDKRVVLLAQNFTNNASQISGGAIIHDGKALWANLTGANTNLFWHWQGTLRAEPGATLWLVTGSAVAGTRASLNVKIKRSSQTTIIDFNSGSRGELHRYQIFAWPLPTPRSRLIEALLLLPLVCVLLYGVTLDR